MCAKVSVFDEQNDIKQYTIRNVKDELVVKVLDYGAIITNVLFIDKAGKQLDLVLGFDTFDGYLNKDNPHFGALVGRVANRIAFGQFSLNDTKYQLDLNDMPRHNTLHGGLKGFDKNLWTLQTLTTDSLTLQLISKDGDQKFPESVRVTITYTVTSENELKLEYKGELMPESTKDTIINLTNHSYFNLNGCTDESAVQALNHKVRMNADYYLQFNDQQIPDDVVIKSANVPEMDFTGKEFKTLADRIPKMTAGYDHCYLINGSASDQLANGEDVVREAAVVMSPSTGVTMNFSTTEPSFQFYSANGLDDKFTTKSTQSPKPIKLAKYAAVCLEGQRYVDAINHEKWRKQVILSPKQTYKQITVYKFTNQ